MKNRWNNQWKNIAGACAVAMVLVMGITVVGRTAISELAGLAVAQTSTLWNSVADAAKGDGLSSGIMAQSSYLFNGITFDRLRGAPVADAVAGTGLQATIIEVFNGTTYDRLRTASGDALPITGVIASGTVIWNGASNDRWRGGESPVEGGSPTGTLFNSQTTGGALAAVVTTIAASANTRTHVYQVEGRCNTAANTTGITITDGGTTIWSTVATEVLAASNFVRAFPTGLTSATNSAIVITLAACNTAGTGTLIVQADRY